MRPPSLPPHLRPCGKEHNCTSKQQRQQQQQQRQQEDPSQERPAFSCVVVMCMRARVCCCCLHQQGCLELHQVRVLAVLEGEASLEVALLVVVQGRDEGAVDGLLQVLALLGDLDGLRGSLEKASLLLCALLSGALEEVVVDRGGHADTGHIHGGASGNHVSLVHAAQRAAVDLVWACGGVLQC